MKRTILIALAAAALGGRLFADEPARRQAEQQRRIANGVRSGQLTAAEAARLERQQANLHRQVRRDRADGPGLTPRERARINAEQNALSRKIAKQKLDAQTR